MQGAAGREAAVIHVILHRPDFRGDHAADVSEILSFPEETTLKELYALVSEDHYTGNVSSIEIVRIKERKP